MRHGSMLTALVIAAAVATVPAWAAQDTDEDADLLGSVEARQLREAPFDAWFSEGYETYVPNPNVVAALRSADLGDLGDVGVQVFFGTWCGDSRREVPRLLKVLDACGLPADRVSLVAVDDQDDALKRSPGGEERGLEIYRVPTVIVSRRGREISRIVEHPVRSLERDLLAILSGPGYRPSYTSYPVIRGWLADGLLADDNVSARGLAGEVRSSIASEGEIGAAARVLQSRGQTREAAKLFEVNCDLFPESARAAARWAEALRDLGDREGAHRAAERALRLNTDPARVADLVDLLESTIPEGVKSLP